MVATLTVRVYTGASAANQSTAQTGVSFLSNDSAATDLPTRQANPITVGSRSYEKWIKLYIDTAPSNGVSNFKVWGDGAVMTSTTLYFTANYITGTDPSATRTSIANANFNTYTSSNKATWDATTYTQTGSTTRYAVFQLDVGSDAQPGNWVQETINYSYDET